MMFALALAAAAPDAAPTIDVPKPFMHGDWVASCDNVRSCEALALPREGHGDEEGGVPDWVLDLTRGPGAGASPSVTLLKSFGDSPAGAERLRIDGKLRPERWNDDGAVKGNAVVLLRALAMSRTSEILDARGKVIGTLPTSGAAAVLRWLDAQQKRDGTVTALFATGDRPASAVPVPPALPRIAVPPTPATPPPRVDKAWWRARQQQADGCDADRAGGEIHRLDALTSVAIAQCAMGAYQGWGRVYLVDNAGRARPAPLEWPKDAGEYASDGAMLTEGVFDPASRLLGFGAKGRGSADCMTIGNWAWDGKRFRLASWAELDECRGAPPGSALPRWQSANDPSPAPTP